jgi:putative glutathione S-transferase
MTQTCALKNSVYSQHNKVKLQLYLAWACPFCHRVLATLLLAGFIEQVGITWMRNIKKAAGWEIATADEPLFGETSLKRIYEKLDPDTNQPATVPLLVDLHSKTLLSANSAEITRFFSTGMNGAYPVKQQLAPPFLVDNINCMNQWLHENINRAVYRVGFATEQSDYEIKVNKLFKAIDKLEQSLWQQPFLLAGGLTESDLYLLATLVRFDSVYYPLFKCSYRYIADYPRLSEYLSRLCAIEGIAATYNTRLNKQHYYCSVMHVDGEIRDLNPSRIIPVASQQYLYGGK